MRKEWCLGFQVVRERITQTIVVSWSKDPDFLFNFCQLLVDILAIWPFVVVVINTVRSLHVNSSNRFDHTLTQWSGEEASEEDFYEKQFHGHEQSRSLQTSKLNTVVKSVKIKRRDCILLYPTSYCLSPLTINQDDCSTVSTSSLVTVPRHLFFFVDTSSLARSFPKRLSDWGRETSAWWQDFRFYCWRVYT